MEIFGNINLFAGVLGFFQCLLWIFKWQCWSRKQNRRVEGGKRKFYLWL